MKSALFFPGQGSQKPGMGSTLIENFSVAKDTFAEADEALGYSITKLCLEGPTEELSLTSNAQPAILSCSIAALRSAEAEKGAFEYDFAAGHSLGEWTALVAVGALSFADAVRLVHLRGKAMQAAVPVGQGSMAAIIGMEPEALSALCQKAAEEQVCSPANFNGGNQIVISGHAEAIARAVVLAKEAKARAIPLKVSAPFHCAMMAPAAEAMREALESTKIGEMQRPVVANVTGKANQDSSEVKELLVKQVTGAVRWEESINWLAGQGVAKAYECGHGAVVRGLVRKIAKDLQVIGVGTSEDIEGLGA